jgi:hypothetical protein
MVTFRPGPEKSSKLPADLFKQGIDPELAKITNKLYEYSLKKDEIIQKLDKVYNNNEATLIEKCEIPKMEEEIKHLQEEIAMYH